MTVPAGQTSRPEWSHRRAGHHVYAGDPVAQQETETSGSVSGPEHRHGDAKGNLSRIKRFNHQ